jgi:hypothetical protein
MIRLSFLLAFICFSCSQSIVVSETHSTLPIQAYSQDSIYIYFTGGFVNDSLVIEYSGIRIIETGVTTNEVLGFAKKNVLPGKGIDAIRVSLLRPNKKYSTEIINEGGNFVEVWYCKDDELKHYSRAEPFSID